MAEYVDRQRLKEAIREDAINLLSCYNEDVLNLVITEIDEIPAADVEPAVHAEWRNNKNDYPECTNCGYMPAYDPAIDDIWYSPRCPKCGARMKNEEELE